MTPTLILGIFFTYTVLLFAVTWFTARKANNQSFYIGNRVSPWFVVAYGMIGASLSGVTFMSVPGWVKETQFSYMVVVFGYLFGYMVIATVLLPLYYRLKLTTIYTYLEKRFGFWSYKTGAGFFILSRILGASLRMFLVINVLQIFVFDAWDIPFFVTIPMRSSIPISEKIFNVCPKICSDSNAPAIAVGTVSIIMNGSRKLSNCAERIK